MFNKSIRLTLTVSLVLSGVSLLYGWGGWGHKHINHAAVLALPPDMRGFYFNHIDFITEGAVVPDLRRGLLGDRSEGPRHYIDIEDFGKISIDALPRTMKQAYAKYDSGFLQKTGILPWYIQTLMEKLTTAFTRKNRSEIIFLSAEIGHYIADAHMPLHTATNHDGQLTNQRGIHALWESRLPEIFGKTYNFNTGEAIYINDVTLETWKMIKQSHDLEDTLLITDKKLRMSFNADQLYKKDASGKHVLSYGQQVFSDEYSARFHQALNGMVENQMRLSVADVANYWYTAWVNGGKPNLNVMDDPALTRHNKCKLRRESKRWKKGRLTDMDVNTD